MNGHREILFASGAVYATLLSEADLADLQHLLESSSDYNDLLTGLPVDSDAARELLTVGPPGKPREDKFVFGIYLGGNTLIGVLDAIRDYPSEGVWYVGLLLLEPRYRRQGQGESIYRAFERWASQSGAQEIRLGVLEANAKALRFWQRLGFTEIERRPPRRYGLREHVVIEFSRKLEG
jgi:ribosomal protein S18 acetylase RimI-like enzyme